MLHKLNYCNLDIIVFFSFLLGNIILGIYCGKKIKTFKQYSVGNQNFNTITLIASIVVTWIGGVILSDVLQQVYSNGIQFFISDLPNCISFIICYFLAARMNKFLGATSIVETMDHLYGKYIKHITSIISIIISVSLAVMQFKVFGRLISHFFDISATTGIICSGLTIIIYSCFGGIKAIAHTDVLQLAVLVIFIPFVGFIVWQNNSLLLTENILSSKLLSCCSLFNDWKELLIFTFSTLHFIVPCFYPAHFQRFSIAKNTDQLRIAFFSAAIILLIIKVLISFISITLHTINPYLNPAMLLGFIVENHSHQGLKGLIMIGVASFIMSTADSHINSASVAFTVGLCNQKSNTDKMNLKICRIATIIIGFFSILLALSKINILNFIIISTNFYIPMVTIPFILAIIGFKISNRVILMSVVLVGFATILWNLFISKLNNPMLSILVSIYSIFTLHYLFKESNSWLEKISCYNLKFITKLAIRKIKYFNLFKFFIHNAPTQSSIYTLFGFFALISSVYSIYTNMEYIKSNNMVAIIYIIMLLTSIVFASYSLWSKIVKNQYIISTLWFFGIFYLLTFCNSFFVLLSNFDKFQTIIFTLNFIIIFMLNKYKITLLPILLGLFFSVQIYTWLSLSTITVVVINLYNIAYVLLMLSTVILLFILRKEKKSNSWLAKSHQKLQLISKANKFSDCAKAKFIKKIHQEFGVYLKEIYIYAAIIEKYLENNYNVDENIVQYSNKIKELITFIHNKTTNFLELTEFSLINIIKQAIQINMKLSFAKEIKIFNNFQLNMSQIYADELRLKQVIISLLSQSIDNSPNYSNIFINSSMYLENKQNWFKISIIDESFGLDEETLELMEENFNGSADQSPFEFTNLKRKQIQQIISLHQGTIEIINKPNRGKTVTILLPLLPIKKCPFVQNPINIVAPKLT